MHPKSYCKTGYFARPPIRRVRRACSSEVHLVDSETGKPICGYKPHSSMEYHFCAADAHLPYIKCKKCLESYPKFLKKKANSILETAKIEADNLVLESNSL